MKKIKCFIKRNYKIVIGIIIGLIIMEIAVYAESRLNSSDVSYDNETSGLTSTDMQGAIDELNTKATTKIDEAKKECPDGYICKNENIVNAYTYNSSSCVTGEESTCVETQCYENKRAGSCEPGTIIKYKVNDSTIKYFHVLHDDGDKITLQQRDNTIYNVKWNTEYSNTTGPVKALQAIESATSNWTNIEYQTYTMGTTNFNGTNAYTGCDTNLSCTTNTYALVSRVARARMITVQEATAVGCTRSKESCPIWMYNYLYDSTNNGGTINDRLPDTATDAPLFYHTMSASTDADSTYHTHWVITDSGYIFPGSYGTPDYVYTARAVVVINK